MTTEDPTEQAKAFFFEGNALFEAGQLEDALSRYQSALALVPGRPSILANLGVTQCRLGRWVDAVATLTQATQADPALQKLDADDRAALAGLLQSRLAQVLPAPAEALDTFARLQITLIGAVVREAITLPPPQAQRLLAQFKRGLVVPDFG